MTTTYTYTTKSSAIRGANRAGFDPEAVEVKQNAAGVWFFAPKPALKGAAERAPAGRTPTIIALCSRPEGATRPELRAAFGLAVNNHMDRPWTNLAKRAGERWGFEFSSVKRGEHVAYCLTQRA